MSDVVIGVADGATMKFFLSPGADHGAGLEKFQIVNMANAADKLDGVNPRGRGAMIAVAIIADGRGDVPFFQQRFSMNAVDVFSLLIRGNFVGRHPFWV